MSAAQRSALRGMVDAILAVKHCPADIRFRAESLRDRLDPPATVAFVLVVPLR